MDSVPLIAFGRGLLLGLAVAAPVGPIAPPGDVAAVNDTTPRGRARPKATPARIRGAPRRGRLTRSHHSAMRLNAKQTANVTTPYPFLR